MRRSTSERRTRKTTRIIQAFDRRDKDPEMLARNLARIAAGLPTLSRRQRRRAGL